MCGVRRSYQFSVQREGVDPHKWPYSPFSKKFSRSSVKFSESSWSSINFRMTANSAWAQGEKTNITVVLRTPQKERSELITAALNPQGFLDLPPPYPHPPPKLKLQGLSYNTLALYLLFPPRVGRQVPPWGHVRKGNHFYIFFKYRGQLKPGT